MKNTNSYKLINQSRGLKLVFLVLFLAVLVTICFIFRYYFWPVLFALVLYIILKPIHERLMARFGSRTWATALLLLLFLVLIMIPLFLLLLILANQSLEFYQLVTHKIQPDDISWYFYRDPTYKKVLSYLGIKHSEIYKRMLQYLQETSFDIFTGITGAVGLSIKFLVNFFFTILLLAFFFMEAPRLSKVVYTALPFPNDIEKEIYEKIKKVIKVLIAGNFLIMFLQGLMIQIAFLVLGLPLSIIAACAAAVFSLIPIIGTSVAWIPGALYFLYMGMYAKAAILAVWSLFWYLFLENFVKAKMFGQRLNFHPVIFFFLLLGSIQTFNLPGIIIGPVLLTLFFSLWEIYRILDIYDPDKNKEDDTSNNN